MLQSVKATLNLSRTVKKIPSAFCGLKLSKDQRGLYSTETCWIL